MRMPKPNAPTYHVTPTASSPGSSRQADDRACSWYEASIERSRTHIVTSNRQSLVEDDERVVKLLQLLRASMRQIEDRWSGLRASDKSSELRAKYPEVGKWIDSLKTGWRQKAERLLERVATLDVALGNESPEDSRRLLLRHAVLGFERLRLRGDAEELEKALEQGVDALLRLFADRDALEAAFYHDIVRSRLEVISKLQDVVDANKKERILQDYLFDHLWLLDPSWERATGSEEKERQLKLLPEFGTDEETKKRYGRVDIRYRTVAGKHVIVELKRMVVPAQIYKLSEQGAKYVDATRSVLPADESDHAQIEVVFVVGERPSEPSDRIEQAMNSVAPGSRIVTYGQLIEQARQAYSSFLEGNKAADRIEALFVND